MLSKILPGTEPTRCYIHRPGAAATISLTNLAAMTTEISTSFSMPPPRAPASPIPSAICTTAFFQCVFLSSPTLVVISTRSAVDPSTLPPSVLSSFIATDEDSGSHITSVSHSKRKHSAVESSESRLSPSGGGSVASSLKCSLSNDGNSKSSEVLKKITDLVEELTKGANAAANAPTTDLGRAIALLSSSNLSDVDKVDLTEYFTMNQADGAAYYYLQSEGAREIWIQRKLARIHAMDTH
ncbi:hypothetical protein SERLA73DRAFT_75350 [Serpula lacrymans var. lacrymans S7.3]|uniref:Uncharacterized protein n=2 Tax=Serpula lacrymans var. lacrymans TaxID=341189 RepID=F8Q3D0_SERL3|nr:uncharacterized protein SERLADRAFT_440022 [Serpula lacrymans var. lacrymans S7.9]EGN97691.1 hypothetical protein SERLA73DRAFT_75350 [Serpula lacrymans var. lacrymans S7.3]EGO23285.1 hypothetical protein SERLADRAFT_440022 [Serpula lacrymans var. lacrymans S7.9]